MRDPLLEEIRRVRKALIRKHGGWEDYERQIRKREAEHHRLERRRTAHSDSMWAVEAAKTPIIRDPMLEEIWRVREQLLIDHGGWDGYVAYIKKLEAEQRQRLRRRKLAVKVRRTKQQQSTTKPGNSRPKRKSVA